MRFVEWRGCSKSRVELNVDVAVSLSLFSTFCLAVPLSLALWPLSGALCLFLALSVIVAHFTVCWRERELREAFAFV